MDDFIQSNPGFKSRVPHTMYFADYTCSDMQELSALFLKKQAISLAESARTPLQRALKVAESARAHSYILG